MLSARSDVVCIQEAQGIPEDAQQLMTSHKCYAKQLAGPRTTDLSSVGGGVAFSVRLAFMRRFAEAQHKVLVPGRASSLRFARSSGAVFKINVLHMGPALAMGDNARFLERPKA